MKSKIHRLSVSGLKTFLECPQKFYLSKKIEKKKKSVHFVFGSAMHKGFEPFWKGQSTKFSTAWLEAKHLDIDYGDKGENWKSMSEKGIRMIDALEKALTGAINAKMSKIEITDNVKVGKTVLSRRIDVITSFSKSVPAIIDGIFTKLKGQVILDLKTSSKRYGQFDAQRSLQLKGYMVKLKSVKAFPKHSAFIVVTKAKIPEVQIIGTHYTEEKAKDFENTFIGVSNLIDASYIARNFPKHTGYQCGMCDFKEVCYKSPGWKNLYQDRKYEQIEEGQTSED